MGSICEWLASFTSELSCERITCGATTAFARRRERASRGLEARVAMQPRAGLGHALAAWRTCNDFFGRVVVEAH
jgi:hypothetical protein